MRPLDILRQGVGYSTSTSSTCLHLSTRSLRTLRRKPTVSHSSPHTDGSPRSTEQSNFFDEFIATHRPPPDAVDHFASIPWTKKILDGLNGAYAGVPFYSRYLDESTGESRFFAETVNTPTTVPHVLSFYRKDLSTPEIASIPQTSDHASSSSSSSSSLPSTTVIDLSTSPELLCLVHVGRDLEAHPGIVNGGFQGVIFDEVMYLLILLHQNNVATPGPRAKHYTLSITTEFISPVRAPSDVLIRAGLVQQVGRKWFTRAEIVDWNGKVLTKGESWWLTARNPLS